jgi:hypothetical protein
VIGSAGHRLQFQYQENSMSTILIDEARQATEFHDVIARHYPNALAAPR